MKHLFNTFFALLFCSAILAQTTPGQLLASAWADPAVQLQRAQQAYLEDTDFGMPLLRKMEIRTATRDLDPKQQSYSLRFGTNGFGMMRTQSAIYGSMKELTEAERQMLVQEALLDRYELLLDLHFTKKTIRLLEQQRQVLLDKKAVFGQQLALGLEEGLDDFFRTEDDLMQLERKLFEKKSDEARCRLRTKIFTGNEDTLSVGQFVTTDEILLFIGLATSTGTATTLPTIRRRAAQAELALQEEKMSIMEGRNLLNFLQIRYTGRTNDPFEDRIAIGAGFDLPWPNSSKLKQQELHLRTLNAQARAEAERQAVEQSILLKSNQWEQLMERFDFLEKQAETFRQAYDPQRLLASGLENPETLLRVQESLVRLDLEMATLEKDIYVSYLSLLNETGLLTAEPARNYLSAGLELISR